MENRLKSKRKIRSNPCCLIFKWKNLQCELCKTKYPSKAVNIKLDEVSIKGKVFPLLDVERPKNRVSIVLEALREDSTKGM
jgi:hypothetical protein